MSRTLQPGIWKAEQRATIELDMLLQQELRSRVLAQTPAVEQQEVAGSGSAELLAAHDEL